MFHHLRPEIVTVCQDERRRRLARRRITPDPHDRFARITGLGVEL